MPKSVRSAEFKFTARDRRRLAGALKLAREARHFKRLQTVLLVASGKSVDEVARLTGAARQSVYNWARRYAEGHRADALRDAAQAGRPRAASELTAERIREELRRDPLSLGYSTQVWTVAFLTKHLAERCDYVVTERTLRCRMRRCYGGRELWLVLDSASCHVATQSQALAARLGIKLLWLPVRCAELNAMDHLWRHLKGRLVANRQFATVDELAERAAQWVFNLSPAEARRKAGVLSKNFWLPT